MHETPCGFCRNGMWINPNTGDSEDCPYCNGTSLTEQEEERS